MNLETKMSTLTEALFRGKKSSPCRTIALLEFQLIRFITAGRLRYQNWSGSKVIAEGTGRVMNRVFPTNGTNSVPKQSVPEGKAIKLAGLFAFTL